MNSRKQCWMLCACSHQTACFAGEEKKKKGGGKMLDFVCMQPPESPSSPGLEAPLPAAFICTSQDRVTARLDVPR